MPADRISIASPGSRRATSFAWRLVSSNSGPVVGDAWIRFESGGGASGSTGCNNFRGTAVAGPGTVNFPQPIAATKMFCPGPDKMAQEHAILAALTAASRYEVDLVTGQLTIEGQTGANRLVYTAARH
jgi:heat shock protein HslJ